jgi:hypothetical protein
MSDGIKDEKELKNMIRDYDENYIKIKQLKINK